mgnify:CR=1 FL=1
MEELPHQHVEHAEHAEHAAHSGDGFAIKVSATIAGLAVVAAIIASLESMETASLLGAKNEAVLKQSQASNQWAYYQAKSVKQNLYELAIPTAGEKAADYAARAKRYDEEIVEIQKKANELEEARDHALHQGEGHEHRHHGLTIAATLVHVGIAVTTLAIITKGKRWPWYAGMALAAAGVAKAALTYLPMGH